MEGVTGLRVVHGYSIELFYIFGQVVDICSMCEIFVIKQPKNQQQQQKN